MLPYLTDIRISREEPPTVPESTEQRSLPKEKGNPHRIMPPGIKKKNAVI